MIDSTTGASVIDNKGISHNDKCNDVVRDIWPYARNMMSGKIKRKQNMIADQEYRQKNIDTEWILNPQFLHTALSNFSSRPLLIYLPHE